MATSDLAHDASDGQPITPATPVGAEPDDAITGPDPAKALPSAALHADPTVSPQATMAACSGPRSAPMPPAPVTQHVAPPVEIQASSEAVQSYIERRIKPQIKWYSDKSMRSKAWHYRIIAAQVVATGLLPVFNILSITYHFFSYASTIAAAISAIAAGAAGIGKYKEHWTRYRQTATTLENMQLEYELSLPPFNGPDRNNLLINSVRKILGDEQKLWLADVKSAAPPGVARASAAPTPATHQPADQDSDDDGS